MIIRTYTTTIFGYFMRLFIKTCRKKPFGSPYTALFKKIRAVSPTYLLPYKNQSRVKRITAERFSIKRKTAVHAFGDF